MKQRKTIYTVIAVVLIVINLLVDLQNLSKNKFETRNISYSVGYFIGGHFFLIIGIVLLVLAYKLKQRIKAKENQELEETIKNIGETNS
jgi:Na+/melibiose symporter-like transporter